MSTSLFLCAGLLATEALPIAAPVQAAAPSTPAFLSESGTKTNPRVATAAQAATTPAAGFTDSVVFSGLTNPTKIRFASNGRVYVAEKSGQIVWFASVSDPTPHLWGDLSDRVHDFWDRGLLGMALAPNFPTDPTIYVQYAYDHNPVRDLPGDPYAGTAPLAWNDACPGNPGATSDGCTILGRISKLTSTPDGDSWTGAEQVLVQGYCQQFPSHSNDDLWIGPDGYLYATAGDGASFAGTGSATSEDFGQWGGTKSPVVTPANPCGDPPNAAGTANTAPTGQGGALRSQSTRRAAATPASLDGALLRISTADGSGVPGNPFAASSDPIRQRILAYGFRNPFRFTFGPSGNAVWVGDVGYNYWEELDRVTLSSLANVNYGWPCVEGNQVQTYYPDYTVNLCPSAPGLPPSYTAPYYTYDHGVHIVANDGCTVTRGSSISGLAFYGGTDYPVQYDGALFFADHSRDCIWAMLPKANGDPDPANIVTVVVGAPIGSSCVACPVDLASGPGGDVFYADFEMGTVHRLSYGTPQAVVSSDVTNGVAPLTVHLDGSGSSSPVGATPLSYSWDLDGNGVFGDSTAVSPTRVYSTPGTYDVRLRVTDSHGASDVSPPYPIVAGDTPPHPVIDLIDGAPPPAQPSGDPPPAVRPNGVPAFYAAGDTITFHGLATDDQQGTLPAASLAWQVSIFHCPDTDCHTHALQQFNGVASGSFAVPQHDYPSLLEIRLTATDAQGLTASSTVYLYPRTSQVTLRSVPSGLDLTVGSQTDVTPFSVTYIEGSAVTISAPPTQLLGGATYGFVGWSDGGRAAHPVAVGTNDATYTATYAQYYRIWGPDRYGTSAAAANAFPLHPATVYVATGENFPDAIAAAAAAGAQGSPLLLTQRNALPPAVAAAITALGPTDVVLVGGVGSVSDAVKAQLQGIVGAGHVRRLAGPDRYQTAVAVARDAFPGAAPTVYVATGADFPDGIVAAPLAARRHAPLVLVPADSLPASVASALGAWGTTDVVLVGGTGAISDAVKAQLEGIVGAGHVNRPYVGVDRYDTAARIAAANWPANPAQAYIATGLAFPDALSAAGLGSLRDGPVLLVRPGLPLPASTQTAMAGLRPLTIVVVGGPASVSDAVVAALAVDIGP
ncbi:MAG TPA: cell wall-binding repeat-containing protein [Candidatus Dormibacteraeota bacterium]|nr:cell wall-binding repeat-containing protein [Candidatus Dormibacteraeota bacterium]